MSAKVGDRVKVRGTNKNHCCYGMVGVISYIRPPMNGYGPSACVVFDDREDEFGEARDYHWCDPKSLVHTTEECTVMDNPLARLKWLFQP